MSSIPDPHLVDVVARANGLLDDLWAELIGRVDQGDYDHESAELITQLRAQLDALITSNEGNRTMSPTAPKNSPLDSFKETAHLVNDLIEQVAGYLGEQDLPEAHQWTLDVLDSAAVQLVEGLAQHVPEIDTETRPMFVSRELGKANTYDDGTPIHRHIKLDDDGHAVTSFYPRRDGDPVEHRDRLVALHDEYKRQGEAEELLASLEDAFREPQETPGHSWTGQEKLDVLRGAESAIIAALRPTNPQDFAEVQAELEQWEFDQKALADVGAVDTRVATLLLQFVQIGIHSIAGDAAPETIIQSSGIVAAKLADYITEETR
ncbi:hypothetical protein ACL9RL_09395 [Plantibacter sp. Mn2098]|uniref:hypothetical protein n=1 Tax=Plantibacter sp. Mn2098 TaxID=3395266 RepID=UPI003BCEE465